MRWTKSPKRRPEQVRLNPTDYYVRFLPADTTQMDTLLSRAIELFHRPLDTMQPVAAEPRLSEDDDTFRWLYAVVPVDFTFPENIDYEILYGVFIQREEALPTRGTASPAGQLPSGLYEKVLARSLQLTGNAPSTRSGAAAQWQPSARIRYTSKGDRPLPGVKVRVQHYTNAMNFKHTDASGETGPICTARGPVNYDIAWQGAYWNIHWKNTNDMYVTPLASNSETRLDTIFSTTGQTLSLAGVHRGLYAYFHEDLPLAAKLVKPERINVAFINQYHPDMSGEHSPARQNRIHVYGKWSNGTYLNAQRCTGIVTHELGHASHYALKPANYLAHVGTDAHCESWANGIRYVYMESFYPGDPNNMGTVDGTYTRLVESLMNQGITLETIQLAFNRGANWKGWKEELQKITDLPDNYVEMIFNHPNNLCFDLTDLLEDQFPTYFNGQMVVFRLAGHVPVPFEVTDWKIVEGTGRIIHSHSRMASVVFDGYGEKKIRATVKMYDNAVTTVEKSVWISYKDMINVPAEAYTYEDITCSMERGEYLDSGLNVMWSSPGAQIRPNNYTKKAVLKYTRPGVKTVTAKVTYGPPASETIEYERTIRIAELPVSESFRLVELGPYSPGGNYTLQYKKSGPVSVNHINIRHNRHFINPPLEWSFDALSGKVYFKLPANRDISVDYTLDIFFTVPGNNEVLQAEVRVSSLF